MKQYDAIIIGFGKGGKLLAAELAERNWKVAIVERSPQMYGGTCVNVGCIPTKALIHESEYAEKRYYDDYKNQSKLYALAVARKYNPQIQISAESETKRSIFREKDKTKRSKKESAQHSKSRNKSFVMTSVSAL